MPVEATNIRRLLVEAHCCRGLRVPSSLKHSTLCGTTAYLRPAQSSKGLRRYQ